MDPERLAAALRAQADVLAGFERCRFAAEEDFWHQVSSTINEARAWLAEMAGRSPEIQGLLEVALKLSLGSNWQAADLMGLADVVERAAQLATQAPSEPPRISPDAVLTLREAAALLRIPYHRAAELDRRGWLPHFRLGRQVRISGAELLAFMQSGGEKS